MGGITSGVGIFSGINTAQLIDQLISIEARPKQIVQQRNLQLQQQQAAYLDINGSLLALKNASSKFRTSDLFNATGASTSDSTKLSATASNSATVGSYSFTVKRLVTSQQALSKGFATSTNTGVGLTELTLESGGGSVSSDTKLSELNGGLGIERGKIVIRDASGSSATVDLSTAVTVGDVLNAINSSSGVSVKATVDGERLKIADTSTGTGTLRIDNATGFNTAVSLGIAGSATGLNATITGSRVRTISGATALSTLNDGTGINIRDGGADLVFTVADGSTINVDLGEKTQATDGQTVITQTRATSLEDVIKYINEQGAGKVTASINAAGTGLNITDNTTGAGNLIIKNGINNRTAATELGIATGDAGVTGGVVQGRRLISSLNSTLVSSLKGGAGITDGAITITDRSGDSSNLTISAAALAGSLDDVIKDLNSQLEAAGNGARVALNRAGNGLSLTDSSGSGTGNVSATGAAATALGLDGAAGSNGAVNGKNLQSRWIGRATQLSSLNGGKGIGTGTIRITDGSGATTTRVIGETVKTIDELLLFLNASPNVRINAQINANGDGISITDSAGGTGDLKIEDVSGTVAKNLNLAATASNAQGAATIDGSYEKKITFSATDSLSTVVSKINAASAGVSATSIRDGSSASPYRLSLTSQRPGTAGRVIIDSGSADLGLSTLSKGDDAVAFYGNDDPAKAILLTSSSNTLDNVIDGVSITLNQTTDTAVKLVISKDSSKAETALNDFVEAYNAVVDKLDQYDSFDTDTNTSSALFGDTTINNIRDSLRRTIQGTATGVTGSLSRFFQVGVRVGEGGKVEFDTTKFRSALETDPDGVARLISARELVPKTNDVVVSPGITVFDPNVEDQFTELGLAEKIAELTSSQTNSIDGLLSRRDDALSTQVEQNNSRIEQYDVRLAAKRARLERQFNAMEQALSSLQNQSNALKSLG